MQTNALTPDKEEYDEAPARLRGDLWGNDAIVLSSCYQFTIKRQNKLYNRLCQLIFQSSLACFGSMARGSRAGVSVQWHSEKTVSKSHCTVHVVSQYYVCA